MKDKPESVASNLLKWENELQQKHTENYDENSCHLDATLKELSLQLILEYFLEHKLNIKTPIEKLDLYKKLDIRQPFNHFIDYMLHCLMNDGLVFLEKGLVNFKLKNEFIKDKSSTILNKIEINYPEYYGAAKLVFHCAKNYTPVLSGNMSHSHVLFPNGNVNFLRYYFDKITVQYNHIHIYMDVCNMLISHLYSSTDNLSILEVGSGQGLLTWPLLKKLKPKLDTESFLYYFTDISRFFIAKAKKQASEMNLLKYMKFENLDFNKPLINQGFRENSMNLIVSFDAIHAADDLTRSISELKKLLKKDGLLVFIESTQTPRWLNLIWGITPEWWNRAYTGATNPLLPSHAWESQVKNLNFSEVTIFPSINKQALNKNCTMIVCQK